MPPITRYSHYHHTNSISGHSYTLYTLTMPPITRYSHYHHVTSITNHYCLPFHHTPILVHTRTPITNKHHPPHQTTIHQQTKSTKTSPSTPLFTYLCYFCYSSITCFITSDLLILLFCSSLGYYITLTRMYCFFFY